MATKIRKEQLDLTGKLLDAEIASNANISLSKLLNGAKIILSDGSVVMLADFDMGGFKIKNLAAPVNANDAVRLIDLQNSQAGISGKDSVRVATTANITLSGAQTIDGVSAIAGDRVLVKNQTTGSENGIYVVASGAWSRASDANSSTNVKAGNYVFATEGTVNADSAWILSTDGAITVGTTTQTWTQFAKAGQVLDGNGLYYTGNTLHIGVVPGEMVVNADTIGLASTAVTPGSGYNNITVDQRGRVTAASTIAYLTSASHVFNEVPSGTKNGSNAAFTLANVPIAGTEVIYINGQRAVRGSGKDYTISGLNITWVNTATYPTSTDEFLCDYLK